MRSSEVVGIGAQLETLKAYLKTVESGRVRDSRELERLLAACWGEFPGWDWEGMHAGKIAGRLEDVTWQPPCIAFTIERHGAVVLSSTRAELQHWVVDVDAGTADCVKKGRRQLEPMAPRVDVKPIAKDLMKRIRRHEESATLRWKGPDEVHVVTSLVFPDESGFRETVRGRQKRLSKELARLLEEAGWRACPRNRFVRQGPDEASTPKKR